MLLLGVLAFWQTQIRADDPPETFSNEPATNVAADKTVPLPPEARQIAVQFIKTAVVRKNLREAWAISGPSIKQDLTLKQWMTGEIPVVPYPDAAVNESPVKVDWSYPNDVSLQVVMQPKKGSKEKPQVFFIGSEEVRLGRKREVARRLLGAVRSAAHSERAAAGVTTRPPTYAPSVKSILFSARMRRRLAWIGGSLAIVALVIAVGVMWPSTASDPPQEFSGEQAYVYKEPKQVELTRVDRAKALATAAFVTYAVARRRVERSYDLTAPVLKGGLSRAEWSTQDIPVVPFPVEEARWKIEYSYSDALGLQVMLFPTAASKLRPSMFAMELTPTGNGKNKWLVSSWAPVGMTGANAARPAPGCSAERIGRSTESGCQPAAG